MKMRKKLAALLAAAMIASVMPMTAFAATENHVTNPVKVAKDNTTQGNAPEIVIKNDKADVKPTTTGDFYLVLEGAEFLTPGAIIYSLEGGLGEGELLEAVADTYKDGGYYKVKTGTYTGLKFRVDSDTEMAIDIASSNIDVTTLRMPLIAKVTGDVATVSIDSNDTPVGESGAAVRKYTFATSGDAKTSVTVADPVGIYTGKKLPISKFTIKETHKGAMASTKVADAEILVELDNVDYEFDVNNIDVKFGRGFLNLTSTPTFTIKHNGNDKQSLIVSFTPAQFANVGAGEVEIQLYVNSIVRTPEVGELKAEISGDIVTDATYTVANVAEFGVEIKADKEYDFVAGQDETVVFHLNEIVDDSMVGGRATEFRLPKGVYFTEKSGNADVTLKDGKLETGEVISALRDKDGRIEGFTAKLAVNSTKIDKFKFEAKIDITAAFTGDITLKAEGRSIGSEVEATLAKTVAPVKVTVEPVKVKPGFKVQTGGKITIEETDKARLMQGKTIVIDLEDNSGMTIESAKAKVIKGDLRADDIEVKSTKQGLEISVKRRSKEASTIEITDIELRLNRSVAQGYYDVKVGGPAISELATKVYKDNVVTADIKTYGNDNILGKEFVIVGDPITGVKSEVVFTIGSDKYTIDGVEKTMDANAYIKDGRTMVPVRYLAGALGVEEAAIKFNSGIVTIFVGNGNVVQLQVGSKNLVTNGMTIPMVAAAQIIDGRTYVPVTEIGSVFGVTGVWDSAAQTATFK